MWAKRAAWGLVAVILLLVSVGWIIGSGALFEHPDIAPPVEPERRLVRTLPPSQNNQDKVILFGDLHVHTSFSADAALTDTPASKGTPYTTPADACDFARYCAALDFWSINDHAEGLTPRHWQETKQAIRECNRVSHPANPDMVSFLGWEWTQLTPSGSPAQHYGHKNIIFRDTADEDVPVRPIASGEDNPFRSLGLAPDAIRGLIWLAMSTFDLEGYQSLIKHFAELGDMELCGDGDVRSLPDGCFETAATPTELFNKLDQWGFDALVIPHGMAWGNTNPPGADFNVQMDQLSDKYQRLLELYSGHGNSEVYRNLTMPLRGTNECPAPENGYTPCCWQAGEIIRNRCLLNDHSTTQCNDRAATTRQMYLDNMGLHSQFSLARDVVPDSQPDEWGQCDQLSGAFQPAYYYQPKQSAQYMLMLGNKNKRFRPGFIGSSDNHSARPGSSYKELARLYFTDTKEHVNTKPAQPLPRSKRDQPVSPGALQWLPDSEDLSNAFYFTGGLVGVYSADRSREAIWDALYRREVFGTSGPRIGLGFELIDGDEVVHPMGSTVATTQTPRFRINAMGSLKQKPGCPDSARHALGQDRLASLCRNECYYPAEDAYAIERIDVIRVIPQHSVEERPEDLIQDPWKSFQCPQGSTHCSVEFEDDTYPDRGREAVYYARVIQEPENTVQGDPIGCGLTDNTRCESTQYCLSAGAEDDCLSAASHRAWSSPIFLEYAQSP